MDVDALPAAAAAPQQATNGHTTTPQQQQQQQPTERTNSSSSSHIPSANSNSSSSSSSSSSSHASQPNKTNGEGYASVGYFRLIGPDFEITSVYPRVVIGRRHFKKVGSDIDAVPHLGISDDKKMSRKHATVFFEKSKQQWHIKVQGKNHVEVNDQVFEAGQEAHLQHLAKVKIGQTSFFFAYPTVDVSP